MFVLEYLLAVIKRAASEWGKAMLLALGLGPILLAGVYRLFPDAPRNLDDPLLVAAVIWLVVLLLIIAPARIWEEQRQRTQEAAKPSTSTSYFQGAVVENINLSLYLRDGAGHIVSSAASNGVIRTDEYDFVRFPGGTAVAQAQAAIATATAHDATISTDTE